MQSSSPSTILGGQLEALYTLGTVGSLTDDQLLEQFLSRGDKASTEAAFAALVERHGAMVLSVCQRIVPEPHDADDAFQATFLVLACRARAIHGRGTVAAWLFGIARRVAAGARAQATRRRRQLGKLHADRMVLNPLGATSEAPEFETDYSPLLAAIDELPQRLREPIILHYFEGLRTEVIAQRLGCPRGTVLSRLARARDRLRRRLAHREFTLDAILPVTTVSRLSSGAAIPSTLIQTTVKAASCLALAGDFIDDVVPTAVANLAREGVRSLTFARVRLAWVLVILSMASAAIGLAMAASTFERGAAPERAEPRKTIEQTQGESIAIRGLVVDPDGKPVAGASIQLGLPEVEPGMPGNPQHMTTSGVDGRFEASILRAVLDQPDVEHASFANRPVLAALARGLGPDWVKVDASTTGQELVLRLRRDDVPIEGRIVGLEGKPLPGLTVTVTHIAEYSADLLKKLRNNASAFYPTLWNEMRNGIIVEKGGPNPVVNTTADGRFLLTGVGRDRVATVLIEGDPIRQTFALVYTTSDPAYTPLALPADIPRKLLGPRFDLMVVPGRVIEGVIRDRDTGRPIAGAKVRSSWGNATSTSDAQGRYRIAGQPKGAENTLIVTVIGEPYIQVAKTIRDPAGSTPISIDIALKRGVWVIGKVTNRTDGRPVQAVVRYFPLRDNPGLKDCPEASFLAKFPGNDPEFVSDADGRFRAIALPNGGMLAVRTIERGYLNARPLTSRAAGNVLHPGNFMFQMMDYQALVPISPGDVDAIVMPDISLAPGPIQHIQAVGPDGRPVAGIRVSGHLRDSRAGEIKNVPLLSFVHPQPGRLETIVILELKQSMGASVDIKGDEADPIRVVLQPVGTVTGRIVDEDDRPRPNVLLRVDYRFQSPWDPSGGDARYVFNAERFSEPVLTGTDGRFAIEGLVPGISCCVTPVARSTSGGLFREEGHLHASEWTIKPGEVQEWGDVLATKP
jgi:RNA polymerase sigma factor (sigma-70 family)